VGWEDAACRLGFQRGDLRVQGVQGEHRMLRGTVESWLRAAGHEPFLAHDLRIDDRDPATTGGVGTGVLLGGSVVVVGFGGAVG
jgi:hypothetical protein